MANPIYNTQSVSSIKKYIQHAVSQITAGSAVAVVKGLGGGSAEIVSLKRKSQVNDYAVSALNALAADPQLTLGRYKMVLKDLTLELDPKANWAPTVANIMKSGEKVPKGYFAETILQAAIAARFVDARAGSQKVTTAMVLKHLVQFLTEQSDSTALSAVRKFASSSTSKAVVRAYQFKAPNQNPNIDDDIVNVLYTLNEASFKWLYARRGSLDADPDVQSFIKDSITYVNTGNAVQHSDYFYTNGRTDRIDILSLGISGQGKTKADIRTMYYEGWSGGNTGTPHKMSLNLSVKINKVEQVGQITGITSDKLSRLAEVIGSSIDPSTKQRIDEIVGQGINSTTKELKAGRAGQREIYKLAYEDMKKNITSVSNLFKGIEYFVALTEANSLDIVDIGSGLRVYFIKNLEMIEKTCRSDRVNAVINISPGGNYAMKIYAGDKELLEYSSDRKSVV